MIKRVLNIRNQVVFQEMPSWKASLSPVVKTEPIPRTYRRILGAMGWPWGTEPGFLAVLGEEFVRTEGLKARRLFLLAEREGASIFDLHRACVGLRQEFCVEEWLAEMEGAQAAEAVRLFYHANRELPQDRELYLRAPYYLGVGRRAADMDQILGQVTQASRQILRFPKGSRLAGYLEAFPLENLTKPAAQFPPLMALGLAVGELVLNEAPESNQAPKVIDKWDPYTMQEIS